MDRHSVTPGNGPPGCRDCPYDPDWDGRWAGGMTSDTPLKLCLLCPSNATTPAEATRLEEAAKAQEDAVRAAYRARHRTTPVDPLIFPSPTTR